MINLFHGSTWWSLLVMTAVLSSHFSFSSSSSRRAIARYLSTLSSAVGSIELSGVFWSRYFSASNASWLLLPSYDSHDEEFSYDSLTMLVWSSIVLSPSKTGNEFSFSSTIGVLASCLLPGAPWEGYVSFFSFMTENFLTYWQGMMILITTYYINVVIHDQMLTGDDDTWLSLTGDDEWLMILGESWWIMNHDTWWIICDTWWSLTGDDKGGLCQLQNWKMSAIRKELIVEINIQMKSTKVVRNLKLW